MTDQYPEPLREAYQHLLAAEDAMGPRARLQFAQATLDAVRRDGTPEPAKPIWAAVHQLVNSGTTPERFAELVSALRTAGSEVQLAVATVAGEAMDNDKPRAAVWSALRDVVWALRDTDPPEAA